MSTPAAVPLCSTCFELPRLSDSVRCAEMAARGMGTVFSLLGRAGAGWLF